MNCSHSAIISISLRHQWCEACKSIRDLGLQPTTWIPADDVTRIDPSLKICIFESRQVAWFFKPARSILALTEEDPIGSPMPVGEFAALNVLLPYFDAIAKFRGKAKLASGPRFKSLAAEILNPNSDPHVKPLIERLWEAVRNDLFHDGMAYERVHVGIDLQQPNPIADVDGILAVDVSKLLDAVEYHFAEFTRVLRDGTDTTTLHDFLTQWDSYWEKT